MVATLPASDMERADAFYRDVLGVDDGRRPARQRPDIVSRLRAKGVEFLEFDYEDFKTVDGVMEMPDYGKGAWFYDSEGNTISLWEENE